MPLLPLQVALAQVRTYLSRFSGETDRQRLKHDVPGPLADETWRPRFDTEAAVGTRLPVL